MSTQRFLAVVVAIVAIAAGSTSVILKDQCPRMRRYADPKEHLEGLWTAEVKYRELHHQYTLNLEDLEWVPPRKSLYVFGWRDSCTASDPVRERFEISSAKSRHLNGRRLGCEDISREASTWVTSSSLQLAAVGDLDTDATDPDFDVWTISADGALTHVRDDCRK